jgi:hypothetical protein
MTNISYVKTEQRHGFRLVNQSPLTLIIFILYFIIGFIGIFLFTSSCIGEFVSIESNFTKEELVFLGQNKLESLAYVLMESSKFQLEDNGMEFIPCSEFYKLFPDCEELDNVLSGAFSLDDSTLTCERYVKVSKSLLSVEKLSIPDQVIHKYMPEQSICAKGLGKFAQVMSDFKKG